MNKFSESNYKSLYAFYFNSNYFSQSQCYMILILTDNRKSYCETTVLTKLLKLTFKFCDKEMLIKTNKCIFSVSLLLYSKKEREKSKSRKLKSIYYISIVNMAPE